MNILNKIILNKVNELSKLKKINSFESVKEKVLKQKTKNNFLKKNNKLQLIAEIKPKSPSLGKIYNKVKVKKLATNFEKKGASAISVLTDKKFFGGSVKNLQVTKAAVNLPILRKDFIVNEYQVYESKLIGADIVLLIVSVLKNKIKYFTDLTLALGMQPLIEVHNKEELNLVLSLVKPSNKIILGINNRNLKTLKINLSTSFKLIKHIPEQFFIVSESGIDNILQLNKLKKIGFSGVLIGTGLKTHPEIFKYFYEN